MVEHFYPVAGADRLTRIDRSLSGDRSDAIVDLAAARRFLARRWRLIAGVALLCVVAAAIVLSLVPRTYTATAILIVDPRTQKVTQSDAVLGGIGSDAAAVESQVEILTSSTLARRVVAELGLDRGGELTEPSTIERATAGLRGLIGLAAHEPSAAEQRERVLQRFSDRLRVRRRGLTYVLEIAYSSGSAETAAQVGNALADATWRTRSARSWRRPGAPRACSAPASTTCGAGPATPSARSRPTRTRTTSSISAPPRRCSTGRSPNRASS